MVVGLTWVYVFVKHQKLDTSSNTFPVGKFLFVVTVILKSAIFGQRLEIFPPEVDVNRMDIKDAFLQSTGEKEAVSDISIKQDGKYKQS